MDSTDFFNRLQNQASPLVALTEFLDAEERNEQAQQTEKMRFVGYVLDVGYDSATIITSDSFKVAVGGIPRGSFLILAPHNLKGLPPHFTLLRVMETAPTPLSNRRIRCSRPTLNFTKSPCPNWTSGRRVNSSGAH